MKHPIGTTFTSKWCSFANDLADPDLWKRTVAHLALQRLFMEAHQKIEDLQNSFADLNVEDVERDLVAAHLQVIALEELMKKSPSPEREDVPLCQGRRSWSGRTKKALPPAPPLGPMPDGSFRSTVDSWNRERDQRRIEKKLGIPEEGDNVTVFVNELDDSAVIAVGYRRVLYGDHGPYLEFTKHQIHWEAFPVVLPNKPSHAYYDERFTQDSHVKAYEQRKTVRDKPNPPPGEWSANNDRYDTGYADYQPGYIYISADCVGVKNVPERPKPPKTLKPVATPLRPSSAAVASHFLKAKPKVKATPRGPVKTASQREGCGKAAGKMKRTYALSKLPGKNKRKVIWEDIRALSWANPVKNVQRVSKTRAAMRKSCSSEPKGFWVWIE